MTPIPRQIVLVHRRLYELGFSVGNDGNTSYRINENTAWITPAGLNKAKLKTNQICVINFKTGKLLKGKSKPSTEWQLHAEIYKSNPKVKCIVHAHPPYSIACSLAGIPLSKTILPELTIAIGYIPTLPYTCPGTKEIAVQSAKAMINNRAIILARHGVVTIGSNLDETLSRLESVEFASKILLIAKTAGKITPLTKAETARLQKQIKNVYNAM